MKATGAVMWAIGGQVILVLEPTHALTFTPELADRYADGLKEFAETARKQREMTNGEPGAG